MPSALQADVVIGRKAVDADDPMAVLQQPPGEVKSNETGAAGDEKPHYVNLTAASPPYKA